MATAPVQLDEETLIRNFVQQIELPPGVKLKRVDQILDWAGEPALLIYFTVSKKLGYTPARIRALNDMKSKLRRKVFDANLPKWPYVRFFGSQLSMALADDLLLQAQHLATLDPTRPKQANLRRSVSTAYYAVFHLLLASCIKRFSPAVPRSLAPRIARALAHSEMKDVCSPISRNNPGLILQQLVPRGFSPQMRQVAEAFVELQEARHLV